MTDPTPRLDREVIAMRVAREFSDGDVVNLGIGIPTLCSDFVPPGVQILYQSENGLLNCGPLADEGEGSVDLINASGQFLQPVPGMAFFDSVEAFAMSRSTSRSTSRSSPRGRPFVLLQPTARTMAGELKRVRIRRVRSFFMASSSGPLSARLEIPNPNGIASVLRAG